MPANAQSLTADQADGNSAGLVDTGGRSIYRDVVDVVRDPATWTT
jgi:hypothetical protein